MQPRVIKAEAHPPLALGSKPPLERGLSVGIAQTANALILPLDFRVHLNLVVVVPSQRSIYFGQRKMGMVLLNRLRIPPAGQMVKHHLDDFNVGVIHPRTPLFIEANMRRGVHLCYHGTTLPESERESRTHLACPGLPMQ
jgi:hypothetical protein